MTDKANQPGDQKNEGARPPLDKVSENLSKSSPEASAANVRAALRANPKRLDTLSPDGKSRFSLTDDGKPAEKRAQEAQEKAYKDAGLGDPYKPIGKPDEPKLDNVLGKPEPALEKSVQANVTDTMQVNSERAKAAAAKIFPSVYTGNSQDISESTEQLKQRFVPAGTAIEIRGQKYDLNQLSAQGLNTVNDATPEKAMSGSPRAIGSDGVLRYEGHISYVPEVSKGISSIQDLGDVGGGVVQGVGNVVIGSLEYLSQPKAVENSLLGIGPALDTDVDYYGKTSANQILNDATQFAGAGIKVLEQSMGHPMTQSEIGKPAGEAATFFIPMGASKVLKASEMDALGGMQKLEKLSQEELDRLGISRYEMPKLNLERDEFSIKASVPGDSKAWFRANVLREGTVVISDLDKGALPEGTGGHFAARAMREFGALPTEKLIFKNVINAETIDAFKAGVAPADSLLGKCAAKALAELGLTAKNYKFEKVAGKLNLIIETQ